MLHLPIGTKYSEFHWVITWTEIYLQLWLAFLEQKFTDHYAPLRLFINSFVVNVGFEFGYFGRIGIEFMVSLLDFGTLVGPHSFEDGVLADHSGNYSCEHSLNDINYFR